MITGKNCLNYHLENIGYEVTKDCNYCSPEDHNKIHLEDYEEETASHILCECPAFSKLRQEIYGTTILNLDNNDETLKNNPKITIKLMIKFMKKTGVLTRPPKYHKSQLSPKR